MSNERVRAFVAEYRSLIRTAANEEELRSHFNTAAYHALGMRDLKLEQDRQAVRRNRVIIEFKAKGLFWAHNPVRSLMRPSTSSLIRTFPSRRTGTIGRPPTISGSALTAHTLPSSSSSPTEG